MKTTSFLAALGVALVLFSGCESVRSDFSAGVKEKVSGPAFRTQTYAGDTRAVYESARTAVLAMGYKITRFGAAQGVIEAYRPLETSETLRSTRQIRVRIQISPALGGSDVAVSFTELIENDFSKGPGRATESGLRDTAQYEVLFRRIGEGLAAPVQSATP
ncbi:MAG TPA: hypothetical protein PLN52_17450 [Opitutaceae bacterium]|nr:hypothetical protein [Opitutaceae bacterium]